MAFMLIFEKRNTIFQCNLTFKSKTFTCYTELQKNHCGNNKYQLKGPNQAD